MKALQYLNKYFIKYKGRLLLGFLFIILTNISRVYAPQIIRESVNFLETSYLNKELINSGDSQEIILPTSLEYISQFIAYSPGDNGLINQDNFVEVIVGIALVLGLLYIIVFAIQGVFLFFTRQTIIIMSRLIEYDLKNEIFQHYQKLSSSFYKRNNTGDLMNRISEDVSKVRMYLGPAVMYTLNLIVLIFLVVMMMSYIDLELTLYALSPLPLMSVAIYYVSSIIHKRSEKVQEQQSKLSSIVQESIAGIRVLKAYTRESARDESFVEECDLYKMRTLDLVKVDALFMPIIVLLVSASTILTIYIGGLKVIAGELAIGEIFQFIFYVNILTWPFASVGWVTSLVQKAEASQKRINEFLKTKPEIQNEVDYETNIHGNVEFKDVSFTYPDSGIRALNNVSFQIEQGKTFAIIGKTGSGKSTIANLINRQYDVTGGEILLDGITLEKHNLYSLRRSIGHVPQDVFLFSDTLRANINFGVDHEDDKSIMNAAKDADIHDSITNFPQGYDTVIGERGINLSGGQKQRISIARAIIKNPEILIFDDCLSAVDTHTEEKILKNLKRIMKGKTSLIISHRVSTIKHADHIIVLDEGRIVEQGTHASLQEKKGVYSNLYKKQLLEEQAA